MQQEIYLTLRNIKMKILQRFKMTDKGTIFFKNTI